MRWKEEVSLCEGKLKCNVLSHTKNKGRLVLWRYLNILQLSHLSSYFPDYFPNIQLRERQKEMIKRFHELSVEPSWLLPAFNSRGWWDHTGRGK